MTATARFTWKNLPDYARENLLKLYETNERLKLAEAAEFLKLPLSTLKANLRNYRVSVPRKQRLEQPVKSQAQPRRSEAASRPAPKSGPRLSDIEKFDPFTDQTEWVEALENLQAEKGRITVMHLCDIHYPYQDEGSMDLAFQLVEYTQPDVIVVGSDAADFALLSSFPIDPDVADEEMDLDDDTLDRFRIWWRTFIDRLRKLAPGAVLVFILGNHEIRYYRYIEKFAPALRKTLTRAFEDVIRCDGKVLFLGHDVDWVRIGPLVVMHGNRVGVTVAKSILNDIGGQASVIFGHVHRLNDHYVNGEDFTVSSHASGCLCSLEPHYMKRGRMRQKWQAGTAIAEVDLNGREVRVHNLKFEKERSRTWVYFERKLFEHQPERG